MKVNERAIDGDGDNLIIESSHDVSPVLRKMEQVRQEGTVRTKNGETSDVRFVGRIPMVMIENWCQEAGVKWGDVHARAEVVKRKILSGEFDKLRSDWKGRY